jgi:essential nuclear protein 1
MPKANPSNTKPRHTPLHVALDQDAQLAKFGRVSRGKKARGGSKGDGTGDDVEAGERTTESSRMSRKILDLARDQQSEISREIGGAAAASDEDEDDMSQGGP